MTVAGAGPRVSGLVDGVGAEARFRYPLGIAVFTSNQTVVYVCDSHNRAVRHVLYKGWGEVGASLLE